MNVPRRPDPPRCRLPQPDAPAAGTTDGALARQLGARGVVVVVVEEYGGGVLAVW